MSRGKLIVISGPSGVGKGTIRENMEFKDYVYSISSTTRNARPGEENGREYYFISKDKFEEKIKNDEMLEYAEFVGNYYGTDKKVVEQLLDEGKNVLLEIECNGAMQVIKKIPEAISIFLLPPSIEELENRLRTRGTEKEDVINLRINKASEEIGYKDEYKYQVINDDVLRASKEIDNILFTNCGGEHE